MFTCTENLANILNTACNDENLLSLRLLPLSAYTAEDPRSVGINSWRLRFILKEVNSLSVENCKANGSGDKMWWGKRPHDSMENQFSHNERT